MNELELSGLLNQLPDEMIVSAYTSQHKAQTKIRYLLPIAACLIVGVICAVNAPKLRVQTPPAKPQTSDTTNSVSDTTAQSVETTTVTGKHSGVSVSGISSASTTIAASASSTTNTVTEPIPVSSLSAQGTASDMTAQTGTSQTVICTAATTQTKRTTSAATTSATKQTNLLTSATTSATNRTSTSTTTATTSDISWTELTTTPAPLMEYRTVMAAQTLKTETVPCAETVLCEDFQTEICRGGFPSDMTFDVKPDFDFNRYDCVLIRFRTSSEEAAVTGLYYNNDDQLTVQMVLYPNQQADTAQIITMAVAVPKEYNMTTQKTEVIPLCFKAASAKQVQETITFYDKKGVTFSYEES